MFNETQQQHLRQVVKTLQIIVASLASGVIVFAVVIFILLGAEPEPTDAYTLTTIGAALAPAALLGAVFLPSFMVYGQTHRRATEGSPYERSPARAPDELGDVVPLANTYQIMTILGTAMLEGAAFLNLAAYLIEKHGLNLVFAVALLLAIFYRFPSLGRIENWIRREIERIEQLRHLGD